MKTIVPILCLCAAVLMAQDQLADPFGSPPNKLKRAVDLEKCVNGHKTLKDVEIAYGRGAGNDPEVAKKLERGDAILGGCIPDSREHWVMCRTCGLRFDDTFDSWRDERWCSEDELRLMRSPLLQGFPIAGADASERIVYLRWFSREALSGESVSFWTTAAEKDIIAALRKWVPKEVKIKAPKQQSEDRSRNSWKWQADGNSFELNYLKVFEPKPETHLQIEWHRAARQE